MNSLREMDFISSASYSCSFELLKIQIVCAVGESMNSGRRSSELFCVFSAINGEMALIWPIVHYFYRVSVFPEISQSPPVFLMVLEASFEHWADSLEHSVGVLHISTEWLHTEDSLNIFPAGPVNGGLQRLKALVSMTPLLLPPCTPFSPAPDALHNTYPGKLNYPHLTFSSAKSALRVSCTGSTKTRCCPVSSEQRSDGEPAVSDVLSHDKPLVPLPTGPGPEINAYFVFTKAN